MGAVLGGVAHSGAGACPYVDIVMAGMAMIKVFKTPSCAYCKQTMFYLASKGAEYEVIDVSEEHSQEYAQLAHDYGYSLPLVTNGKITYTGWNLAKLNQMIRTAQPDKLIPFIRESE